ncbi:hypothetical protein [Halorubrum tibetense]|uniref:Uncharacterized protein n=1 Tax=Halorubrum tibetense TaxID=175631 RepID=A0ABD5SBP5_9EURY
MQTGTTPARRIATEPASGRSAPITGACRGTTPMTSWNRPPAAIDEAARTGSRKVIA